MNPLEQLQDLLRGLFQTDNADFDFGIYRLLQLKRREVETFLTQQLPSHVANSVQTLTTAHQNEIFNHLATFFSRYYDTGDFVPQRFAGGRGRYAVPYNGEETLFHWANRDQHYVKSSLNLRHLAFEVATLDGTAHVRFDLADANLPPGNAKGKSRAFFPLPDQITWDANERRLVVPFAYRPPEEAEVQAHGKNGKWAEGNGDKGAQLSLLLASVPLVLEAVPDANLRGKLAETDEKGNSFLLRRMKAFVQQWKRDYFVHRNLREFLNGEQEYYLKDQVLHLADIDTGAESLTLKLNVLRVVRQIGQDIIAFLAQIEDAQNRLFEKRKFVLQTDYLVGIRHVPREFWPDILDNTAQIGAWQDLYKLDTRPDAANPEGGFTEAFLEAHPSLVVNTAHFDLPRNGNRPFYARLLESLPFDDLDEATDGLLVHSENYQALRLLENRYAESLKCIYIDPPYNTGSDGFIYKDRYRHSTWLAMMQERLTIARNLLSPNGVILVSIGEEELANLRLLMDEVFGEENFRNTLMARRFDKNLNTQFISKGLKTLNVGAEYIVVYSKTPEAMLNPVFREASENRQHKGYWKGFWNDADRSTMRYDLLGVTPGSGQWKWKDTVALEAVANYDEYLARYANSMTLEEYWEQTGKNKRFIRRNMQGKGVNLGVENWIAPSTGILRSSDWTDILASETITSLGITFDNPKNVTLIENVVLLGNDPHACILDFFGGSGTTAHAVVNLNRQDNEGRKFILAEMGEHFDDVILPRVQKVMYGPEWKDGRPVRACNDEELAATPRLVKILRLESYEDALHNLATVEQSGQATERANAIRDALGAETYRMHYLLRLPLETSDTLLNLAALDHPFFYELNCLTDAGNQTFTVDLIETFALLHGLRVGKRQKWINAADDSRPYIALITLDRVNRPVLVVWRDVAGLDIAAERSFLETQIAAYGPFANMLINSDTATPGFRSLDPLFKQYLVE